MLVIHPDECVDCGVCEPECPVDAIKPDTEPGIEKWLDLNREYSVIWPNITKKKSAPPDADAFVNVPDKLPSTSPPILAKAIRRTLDGVTHSLTPRKRAPARGPLTPRNQWPEGRTARHV